MGFSVTYVKGKDCFSHFISSRVFSAAIYCSKKFRNLAMAQPCAMDMQNNWYSSPHLNGGAEPSGIQAGQTGNLTQLSSVVAKMLEMQTSIARIVFFFPFFICQQSRKTMEEKLNEKRQELHPPPEFSDEDRRAYGIAMVLYKDCEE